MKAIVEATGKVGSRVRLGNHELVFDQPASVPGGAEVESEKERLPSPRIGRLSMKVHLPSGLDERQLVTVTRAIKSCPAYGTLLNPPNVELAIEVEGGAVGDKLSA